MLVHREGMAIDLPVRINTTVLIAVFTMPGATTL